MQHKFRSFGCRWTSGTADTLKVSTTLDVVNVVVLQMKRGAVLQNYKDNSGALVVQLIFENLKLQQWPRNLYLYNFI